jgi:hypothetical protein
MAEIVGEDGRAEAGGKRDAAIVAGAGVRLRAMRIRLGKGRWSGCEQHSDGNKRCRTEIRSATALSRLKGHTVGHGNAPCFNSRLSYTSNPPFQMRDLMSKRAKLIASRVAV